MTRIAEPVEGLIVRDAKAGDETVWRALWRDYLRFYDVTLPEAVTDLTWSRILDPESLLRARFAVGEEVLGFALHHRHLTTWAAGMDCYLEDLFVSQAARGRGVGRVLIEDLVRLSRDRGDARLYWVTDTTNVRARSLYDSFTPSDGHVRYRINL